MWMFTKFGFISVVEHRDIPDHLMVRARDPRPLREIWPDHPITTLWDADYRHRITVHRDAFASSMGETVESIDYDNFKNACHEHGEYQRALGSVWRVMFEFQSRVGDGSEG